MALYVKAGPFPAFDMLRFKNLARTRDRHIARASSAPLPLQYGTNGLAARLHPRVQNLAVSDIAEHSPDVKTYTLSRSDGSPAAYFRAGQYLSVQLEIGGSRLTRPYSICSGPRLALEGKYRITVKRDPHGFASSYILDNWKKGTEVRTSDAEGCFYYEPMRDASRVIALAGGSGITPFLSMASAIRDGEEDFELTVLYGTKSAKDALFSGEFREIGRLCPKVRLVNVYSDEDVPGAEHGFLSAALIRRYAGPGSYSIFACGPQAMYRFLDAELPKLGLRRKFIRRELFGAEKAPWSLPGYPAAARDREFSITVRSCGKQTVIKASANESVLAAMERAGIAAPSRCRSGECGFCHSRLVSGDVFIPEASDGRRAGDKVFGYIHPCASYPIGDLVIDLPGSY